MMIFKKISVKPNTKISFTQLTTPKSPTNTAKNNYPLAQVF